MRRKISWLLAVALCFQVVFTSGLHTNYAEAAGQTAASVQIEDVLELSPHAGQVEVAKKPSLSMELSQPVKKGQSGSIKLQSLSNNAVIKAFNLDNEVKIYDQKGGNEVSPDEYGTYITFDMGTAELQSGGYYVLIEPGTFMKEQDNAPFAGIQDAGKWRFWTEGMGDVSIVEKVPAHNATRVLPSATLTLKFAKDMYPAAGNIEIYKRSDNELVDSISVTSSRVSGGGTNTITITPSAALANNTAYDVVVPAGAFWDAQQNKNQAISQGSWGFTVSTDTTALTVSSLSPNDGNMSAPVDQPLTLTFSKELDPSYTGIATLRKAGGTVVASDTVINTSNKRQLIITPVGQLEYGTTYQVDIPAGVFKDAAGNTFTGLTGSRSWSFKTYTRDTTAPVLQSSKMYTNTLIRLTYNEALSTAVKPLTSSYAVTVNGENRGISDVSISGDSVYVMLDTGVAVGQVVRLSYTPGVRPVQDLSGNSAASFSGREIINNLDSVLSKPREGSVYGNTLYLYFTESVKVTSSSARDQFRVTANGSSIGVSSITISSGSAVTLTLNRAVTDGEVIRVTYTPGNDPLKDYRDQALGGFTDFFVRNSYDTKPPQFVETWAGGNKLYIQYNEALRTDNLPLKSQFSVLVNRSPLYVNEVEVNEDTVELTLANSLVVNQDVTLSYIPGVKRLTDLNSNPAGYLDMIPVTVYGSGSVKQASVNGQTVTLTMAEPMQTNSALTPSQFTVVAGGQAVQATSAAVQNQTLTVTLSPAVLAGQTVTITYSPGTVPLRTAKGEVVAGFGPFALQNITNGSTSGSGTSGMPAGLSLINSSLFNQTAYVISSSAATKSSAVSKYNRTVGTYTPSADLLKQAFAYANSAGSSDTIIMEVPDTEAAAVVGFSMQTLNEAKRQNAEAAIGVRYGNMLYTIPLSKLDLNAIAGQVNIDLPGATLYIQLEAVPATSSIMIDSLLSQGSASKLSSVMDLSAYVSNGTTLKTEFAHQGQLHLRLGSSVSSNTLGLVKVDNTLQRLAPVPFQVAKTTDALIVKADTNGGTPLVAANHPVSYMDLYGHWAKESIERLAAKWVIDNTSGSYYAPDTPITRAEFAGMIARGLGLEGNWESAQRFGDVPYTNSGAYIGAATKAGIITGHQDGTFKPNQLITREQMAIMMVRALHYNGHEAALNGTPDSILRKFKDRAYIQAPNIVAEAVQQGIIQGMTQNTFKPGGQATRAQAAVMITRMLNIQ